LAACGLDTSFFRGGTIQRAAVGAADVDAGGAIGHVAAFDLAELWLNGGGVDTLVVEELLHLFGNLHVLRKVTAPTRLTRDGLDCFHLIYKWL